MFHLLETIQIRDGIIQNAKYHELRMSSSSLAIHGKKTDFDLTKLDIPELACKGIYKCRIIYGSRIEKVEFQPYFPKKIDSLKLVFDDNISYSHKFADRSVFDPLLAQKGKADDIIIVRKGKITDTSFSNIVFRNSSGLFTPSTYLLNGTKRQQLLSEGLIIETSIGIEDINKMNSIILINAMLDLTIHSELNISTIIH